MSINISGNIDFEYSLSRSDVISYYSLLGLMDTDHIRLVEAELRFLTFYANRWLFANTSNVFFHKNFICIFINMADI